MLEIFALLLIGHFVADYPLQGDFIAQNKSPWRPIDMSRVPPGQRPTKIWPYVLTAHGATHGAAVYLVTGSVALALAETIAHMLIDTGKCANRYGIHADQWMHFGCKAIWALIYVSFP